MDRARGAFAAGRTLSAWGAPVFDAQLVRNRHGPVGRWIMEWKCDECLFSETGGVSSACGCRACPSTASNASSRAATPRQLNDISRNTGGRLSPLRGRVGEEYRGLRRLRLTPPNPPRGERITPVNNDPSIVVARQNNALQIFALDDAAARLGLEIGLPLANARAICPQLRVFDADEASDARTLNDIADWCDRFTPLVALDSPHGLFLDITGCAHLFGGEAAMMRLMCDVLTAQGFAVSAAIAGTSVCARTMTRHVHGRIVRDGEEAEAVRAAAGVRARRRQRPSPAACAAPG